MPVRFGNRVAFVLTILITASLACNAQITGPIPPTAVPGPTAVFIAPENNASVADGATIFFAVKATDPGGPGVLRVEFRVDDNLIGTQTSPDASQSLTFTQDWTAQGVQGHLIDALAYRADESVIAEAKMTLQVVAADGSSTQAATGSATTVSIQSTSNSLTSAQINATLTAAAPQVTVVTNVPTTPTTQAQTPTTAPPTATTSSGPTVQGTGPNLNIRGGPGTNYPVIGAMKTGDVATIIGRNAEKTWWVVQMGQAKGWVINDPAVSKTDGDTSNVPLAAVPPSPVPAQATATTAPVVAPTSTTGPVADLVFDSVTLNPATPIHDQTFTVTIVIRNQGTVNAGTSLLVGVFQPGNERSPVAVPAVNSGQTTTVTMPVTLHSSGPNQAATLTLDANNDINEGPNGEANNIKTINYNVN